MAPCPCTCDQIMAAFKGVWTKDFWRAVSGEFLAMLIFVLLSLGSTINWATTTKDSIPPPDLVLISLCFSLSIATLIQCFRQISGAHINPAVTVAMVATRQLSLAKGFFYLGAVSWGNSGSSYPVWCDSSCCEREPGGHHGQLNNMTVYRTSMI